MTTYEVDTGYVGCRIDRELLIERHKTWEAERAIHKDPFTGAKNKLETEFRRLLGIE